MTQTQRGKYFHSMMIHPQMWLVFFLVDIMFTSSLKVSFSFFHLCYLVSSNLGYVKNVDLVIGTSLQGVTIDERGRITSEAEKKLEEVNFHYRYPKTEFIYLRHFLAFTQVFSPLQLYCLLVSISYISSYILFSFCFFFFKGFLDFSVCTCCFCQ